MSVSAHGQCGQLLTVAKVVHGGGGGVTLGIGVVSIRDTAATHASDTAKSPTLPRTEGDSVIPDSWRH